MKASFGPDTGSGKISPFGRNDKFLEYCHFEEPRLGRGKLRDEKSYTGSGKISPFGRNDNEPLEHRLLYCFKPTPSAVLEEQILLSCCNDD